MPGFKRHIVILLVGIFIFPLAYQPWHVVWHHSQELCSQHGCCQLNAEHSAKEAVGCDGPVLNPTPEKEEPCPICDYHFPVNILPKFFYYPTNNLVAESAVTDLKIRLPFQQVTSVKSPRAPPAKA